MNKTLSILLHEQEMPTLVPRKGAKQHPKLCPLCGRFLCWGPLSLNVPSCLSSYLATFLDIPTCLFYVARQLTLERWKGARVTGVLGWVSNHVPSKPGFF